MWIEYDSFNFLRGVILYGMYSNWFISFFDKLSFPMNPKVLGDQQWFFIGALIITLFIMFLVTGVKRVGISIIHLICLICASGLEVIFRLNYSSVTLVTPLTRELGKFFLFSMLGLLIWFLIISSEGMLLDIRKSIKKNDVGLDLFIVKLSKRHQATIPIEIRTKYDFKPGDSLVWKEIDGNLVIEKEG
jgi:hypothetical protein